MFDDFHQDSLLIHKLLQVSDSVVDTPEFANLDRKKEKTKKKSTLSTGYAENMIRRCPCEIKRIPTCSVNQMKQNKTKFVLFSVKSC